MSSAYASLLQAIRRGASARSWSQGVELARGGQVFQLTRTGESVELKVVDAKLRIAPQVVLYIEDAEWDCDCGGEDPCAHVAAASIALKQAAESNTQLPSPTTELPQLIYRLKTPGGSYPADSFLLSRATLSAGREEPLDTSLAKLLGSDSARSKLDISQADLQLDRALLSRPNGNFPAEFLVGLLRHLSEVKQLELNGAPIRASSEPLAPIARVRFEAGAFQVKIERHPDFELLVGPGLGLATGCLRPLGATELTGKRLQNLPSQRSYPKAHSAALVSEVLPGLRQHMSVEILTDALPQPERHLKPRVELQINQAADQLNVMALVVYGDPPVARVDGDQLVLLESTIPTRDLSEEKRIIEQLRHELDLVPGRRQHFHAESVNAFAQKLERYQARHQAGVSGVNAKQLLRPLTLTPELRYTDGAVELSFRAQGEGGELLSASAEAIFRALQQGSKLVALNEGGFAPLPFDFIEQHGQRILGLFTARKPGESLPPHAKPALLELARALEYPAPAELDGLRPLIEGFSGIPEHPLPSSLNATLRSYQRAAVSWLEFMRRAQLGAILADDMGLGKTLQALASLPEGPARALVVCPTSVLANWRREAEKFRPDLSICTYHGPKRQLDQSANLVLTSYALLRMDRDLLASTSWDTLILDEAQYIKNPESQIAQAAYSIPADFRLSLSGTPVENRLDELWSQLHFTNPGLLGGRSEFDAEFARPIAEGSTERAGRLRRQITPFILRRLKREVAPELPPRTDVVLYVELDAAERATYDAVRAATQKDVIEALGLGGEGSKNTFAALEALLRLRQACCHSGLLPGQNAERSSKVELLVEHLERAHLGGHKSLVFSQWTSLLDHVEPELRRAGLEFIRLDGSTADRDSVVQTFQGSGGPSVMLISLKAGGTGLNLTAADHVFLLDPWWNPAVEDQAADRAHRIGQDRPVIVHRMVASDTVEERILALQEQKRSIAEAALGEGTQALQLTRDDLLDLLR